MSKLGTLIVIPIALLGVKRLQELFPDDPNPTPLIPTTPKETPCYPDLIFREKQEVKSCPYGYHLENGICVKSKGIGL